MGHMKENRKTLYDGPIEDLVWRHLLDFEFVVAKYWILSDQQWKDFDRILSDINSQYRPGGI